MNLAPFFSTQFFDSNGDPLAGGKLYTYVSGTTTNQATYTSQAGTTANANPIILDSAGRCDLWLNATQEYTLVLKTSADVLVDTWDNVVGTANSNEVVTSVNSETGAVTLTAPDIGYSTGTTTDWFTATDVAGALDQIIDHFAEPAATIAAADVTVADTGNNFTGTNVETVLAEIDTRLDANVVPSQSGNSGKFLTTNGTALSWGTPGASGTSSNITASIVGGDMTVSVSSGSQAYGSRSVSASGGSGTYTYRWVIQPEQFLSSGTDLNEMWFTTATNSTSVSVAGTGTTVTNDAEVICFVKDSDGRMTFASFHIAATHSA